MELKIFIEGKIENRKERKTINDAKFIQDFVKEHFGSELHIEEHILPLGSWSGYKQDRKLSASIQQNYDDGKTILIFLDADNDIELRRSQVLKDFKEFDIPVNLFLFPNNQNAGCLESALCEIAVDRGILKCFEGYEACIAGYNMPEIKAKVFAYLDALLPEKSKMNNSEDLHHEYLQPLRDFLSPFFTQE